MPRLRYQRFIPVGILALAGLGLGQDPVWAQADVEDLAAQLEALQFHIDILWTLVAAAMVFFMQAGFAMVEAGFTRAKNAANIVLKNLMDFCVGACAFWFIGFGLMFGASAGGVIGTSWFAFSWQRANEAAGTGDAWPFTFFCFQMVFAATAATIVSGAMAERTKFGSYLLYSLVITAIIYPISGSWAWNGLFGNYNGGSAGWLENLGYADFAGSGVVHLVGGAAALAGAIVLGPRRGKYSASGEPQALPGHNLPMGMLGTMILWFGWIGFNAGSTTAGIPDVGWIAMNTFLGGAAGAIGALITSWVVFTKPDMTFAANGALAGLVSITAPCATVHPFGAILIGSIGGVLVVGSVLFIEGTLKIDDPVGASSVHGVCGAWGVIATGIPLFAHVDAGIEWGQLVPQVIGVLAYASWAFGACFLVFVGLKATVGLRVTAEDEEVGLDISEHANIAYPNFESLSSGGM